MIIVVTLLIGIVAGLRAMTAPAAVAWGAFLLMFDVSTSGLWFMASVWTVIVFTILAAVELVTDQLPTTPSRKVPVQFTARILMGGLAGATLGASQGSLVVGLVLGVFGAVVGTFAGAWARGHLAQSFGRDRPAAFLEDAAAILLALIAVCAA